VREDVFAEATVLRRGRDITFVDVTVATAVRAIARGLIAYRAGSSAAGTAAAGAAHEPHPSAQLTAVPLDQFTRRTSGSPFTQRLGVASAQLGRGHALSLLPLCDAILADDGTVHEGAVAALVDCAGGAAAWSIDGFDPDGRAATIGMHLCFDVGTAGEDIAAEATNTWNSDGVYVNSVLVAGRASGRAIASGSVTYRIVKHARKA
jgi:acyl-coenzyme A thioesterase PaaI-like protein